MTTFDTGNPLGSADPRDLFDNAQNADAAVNGEGKTWVDRFGRPRVSMKGVEEAVPDAIAARDGAETAAAIAVLASDSALAGANIYATEAEGRAATADGDTFNVQGEGDVAAYVYRRIDSGASTLINTLPSGEILSYIGRHRAAPSRVPVVVDAQGLLGLWLEDGLLGATGLTPELAETIQPSVSAQPELVPLCVDAAGKVALWLENGLLEANGIGPLLQSIISPMPVLTSGATLRRWLARAAALKALGSGQPRIVVTGDSWGEHKTITEALATALHEKYGRAGTGWLSFTPSFYLDGVTGVRSGAWTLYDANVDFVSPPDGCGPDGFALTSSAAGARIEFGNLRHGDQFMVFFGAQAGSFRWQVDGGAWTVVTPDSADGAAVQSITIALDKASASHQVVLEVVSGKVVLFGQLLRDSAAAGVEVSHVGNGSCTGVDYMLFAQQWVAPFSQALKADLVITILGTNDYRLARGTVAGYSAALDAIYAGYRAGNADCGGIVVAPAKSNAVALTPLSKFRDAGYDAAKRLDLEFVNQHDAWGEYAVENVNGQWADNLHLSKAGATRLVNQFFSKIL